MYPIITLFGKEIGTYALAALAGALVAGFFALRTTRKQGLDDNDMLRALLVGVIGVLIGGHLLYGVTMLPDFFSAIAAGYTTNWDQWVSILSHTFGGSVFYGGLLGGLAAGWLYLRHRKLSLRLFSDIAAPTIALFHAFGRVGCFLGGCCYGIEWEHGITYTHGLDPAANGVPRLPTPLIGAALNLALFVLLAVLLYKGRMKHQLLHLYFTLYPIGRFTLEFFRGDAIRGIWWGLSTSQWVSLILLTVSVILWIKQAVSRPREPREPLTPAVQN